MVDDRRVRDGGIGAADLLGHVRVGHRQALDVHLVDDTVVVLVPGRTVVAPVEEGVHHHREHRVVERVVVVECVRVVETVGEERLVAVDLPVDRLRVRVEQQFRGIAAVAELGVVGAVHPEAVPLTGLHPGQVGVPDVSVDLGQIDALLVPGLFAVLTRLFTGCEQAQFHPFGDGGEDCEVDARTVEGGAERIGLSRPDVHGTPLWCTAGAVLTITVGDMCFTGSASGACG